MSVSWRSRAGVIAVAVTGALGAFAGQAAAQATYEPGVTLRTYFLAQGPTTTCTLKSGQTPNVDKLMSTIDWTTAAQFADGREDNYQSTVLARLNIATAGEHTFRLTSDDGSVLRIDGNVVVDHDGLHGDTSKDGAVTLTAGNHDLRIDYIEAGGGQVLKLEWRAPGSSSFVVVPSSVLSTEAGVVRVTAPGNKYCEGATDTAGDGLRLDTVNPNYTLTDIRPTAFQPKVSGMDFLPDGRMVLTTTGDVSSGGWVPNPESGEVYVLDKVTGTTTKEQVTYTKVAGALKNPMGIQVVDGRWYVSEREGLTELLPDGDDADTLMDHKRLASWPNGGNFHEFAFGLIHDADYFYVARSNAINNGGATTDPQPGVDPGTAIKISRSDVAGLEDRRWPAHAERHRLRPRGRHLRQRQPGCLAAGEQDGPDQAGPLLQPLHEPARPVRHQAGHAAGPVDAAQRDRQLPDEPGAAHRRSVQGPDALGRPHLRRPAARLPREGRRRVPGRGLPPLGGPRGRRQPHGDRARRRDLRRRHR